jgi:hypothetical protein
VEGGDDDEDADPVVVVDDDDDECVLRVQQPQSRVAAAVDTFPWFASSIVLVPDRTWPQNPYPYRRETPPSLPSSNWPPPLEFRYYYSKLELAPPVVPFRPKEAELAKPDQLPLVSSNWPIPLPCQLRPKHLPVVLDPPSRLEYVFVGRVSNVVHIVVVDEAAGVDAVEPVERVAVVWAVDVMTKKKPNLETVPAKLARRENVVAKTTSVVGRGLPPAKDPSQFGAPPEFDFVDVLENCYESAPVVVPH